MFISVNSACIEGIQGIPLNVEVSATTGLPQETMIGLPDTVVKESKSRIKSAIQLAGFSFPAMSYVINLSPSDVIKRTLSMELAISAALLQVTNQLNLNFSYCYIGSLSLDGKVIGVKHILSMIYHYPNWKQTTFVIPKENLNELQALSGLNHIPIGHLTDLISLESIPQLTMPMTTPSSQSTTHSFDAIHGHDAIKKACAYSIIGGHPMLLIGSPGIGKTMLIDHMKTLLPNMSHYQAIENACIQSFIEPHFEFTTTPPFRAPHHSISYAGMLGGKNPPQPGEITRANHGILFLDELGEYQRAILDTLREPLEAHCIQVSRAGSSITYPANFLLIAAMNPCYCGYYFDQTHICTCSPQHMKRYWQKISQPLLDRISICCILSKPKQSQSSILHQDLMAMIDTGTALASKRNPDKKRNQSLSYHELLEVFNIHDNAQSQLDTFIDSQQLSMRGQLRVKKLTRTIADANASNTIKKEHALHAIQLSQHHQLPN